jgi:NAD+ diphosphatase
MIAFTATASAKVDPVPDGEEIVDARWFSRDALPLLPMPGSISRRMVDAWIRRGNAS